MSEEEMFMLCKNGSEMGYSDWYWSCEDVRTKEYKKFVEYSLYDSAIDVLNAITDMGTRDVDMLLDTLSKWRDEDLGRYESIIDNIANCKELTGENNDFYCILNGIEYEAKDLIGDYARMKYGEDFAEFLDEQLNETYLDYNYLAWTCAEESIDGLCEVLEDVINGKFKVNEEWTGYNTIEERELPPNLENVINKIYNDWEQGEL